MVLAAEKQSPLFPAWDGPGVCSTHCLCSHIPPVSVGFPRVPRLRGTANQSLPEKQIERTVGTIIHHYNQNNRMTTRVRLLPLPACSACLSTQGKLHRLFLVRQHHLWGLLWSGHSVFYFNTHSWINSFMHVFNHSVRMHLQMLSTDREQTKLYLALLLKVLVVYIKVSLFILLALFPLMLVLWLGLLFL